MPLSRFDRDYRLVVGVGGSRQVEVRPPMRVAFAAQKSVEGGLNKLTLRIYNLRQSSREAIAKDPEEVRHVPLSLEVGYSGELALIFRGSLHRAANKRSGADIITEIECLDGGYDFLNSFTSRTVRGGNNAIEAVLSDMPNTGAGKIASVPEILRPRVLVGASGKLFDDLIGDDQTWYIDDEQLFVLGTDQVVSALAPVVSSATGLLTTPERSMQRVSFSTLINPALRIGGLCRLESTLAPQMNGLYRINSMGYEGDIDGSAWQQQCEAMPALGYEVVP